MDQGSTDRLLALGAAFAARLAKDAGQLRALMAQLEVQSAAERAQILEGIRSTAHRLRGTAPAFDAADIGDAAGKLEVAIVESRASPGDVTPAVKQQLSELMALLDAALGAHGPPRKFRPHLG
jgi:HPt (histidine-containing phosphotransfer) domain-containing protein